MKKKKKAKKRILLFIIIMIIIGFVITYMFLNTFESNDIEYNETAINAAKDAGVYEKILDTQYSKTLEEVLINNLFDEKYFDEYLEIIYIDTTNFLNNINVFLDKTYVAEEINNIYILSKKNQENLLTIDYIDFTKYIAISNFDVLKYDRYELFLDEESGMENAVANTVTYVNIGLDLPFYENVTEVSNPSDIDVLINKYYKLPDDYEPTNLISIPGYYGEVRIIEEAGNKFTEMLEAAEKDGFDFIPTTAYRDYNWQNTLYSNYVASDGQKEADTYSARAGHSEHQTGYAIDIANEDYYEATGTRLNDEDYGWILDNAHKYGFVVRYPKDSTDITTYIEEPWHLRYFGIELATKIINSGITYDEYYDLYIKEY